jgi:hypothetical protein
MECPWCGGTLEIVREVVGNKVVIHNCRRCGGIVGAYLKEMEEYLANFFERYTLDTFKPSPTLRKEG